MALANLTSHNPFEIDRSANIQASKSFGDSIGAGISQFTSALEKREERRRLDDERKEEKRLKNLDIEEREQTKATEQFGNLLESTAGSGAIATSLNGMAIENKKRFIEASREIREPGTSEERRAELRSEMDNLGNQAKSTAKAFSALQENASAWNDIVATEGISDATPKPIREFMQDIIKRENQDGYTITSSEDGRLKFTGETSEGSPVDFYLDEVAEGANTFRAIPKFKRDDYIQGLVESIPKEVEVIENEYGLAQQNNSKLMGEKAATAIMDTLNGQESFRAISADFGFDYDDIENLNAGTPLAFENLSEEEIAELDKDGDGVITNEDELKGYLANQLLADLSEQLPTGFKQVNTAKYQSQIRQEESANTQAQKQAAAELKAKKDAEIKTAETGQFLNQISNPKQIGQFVGTKTNLGTIQKIQNKDGKVQIAFQGHTKQKPKLQQFDLSDPAQMTAFSELMGYDAAEVVNIRKQSSRF